MASVTRRLPNICFSSSGSVLQSEFLKSASQITPRTCSRTLKRMWTTTAVADIEIRSLKNSRVKDARALLRRRQRERDGKILLEGQRLIADALQSGILPREFFYTHEALERCGANRLLKADICQKGAKDFLVSEEVIRSLSDTVNPQGLVAIFDKPDVSLPRNASLTLICDEVRDPGNLGTLLRSAAGAGVETVLLTPGCADIWNFKVLRSGMGAQFRLPVTSGMSWPDIVEYLGSMKSVIRVAEGSAQASYSQVDWKVPSALIIGSEAEGPSEAAFAAAHESIGIPMAGGVESLNAAMAGTIILFEAQRQRGLV